MRIAIIDTIGLPYDGETISHRGLGGSESAVIFMSRELAKIGFEVTVFNNCIDDHCMPGIFDDVKYLPLTVIGQNKFEFDILISSRTIIPFVPPEYYHMFTPDQYGRMHDPAMFRNITAKHKILWMHDTFCMGDEALEDLVRDGFIDEIFTLSDFHTTYIANCHHGKRRNFEVLKNKIFQTRNGVVNYIPDVDITAKDLNHFVFNAAISKGMVPLVTKIWPEIRKQLPMAHLTIIGGYYLFSESGAKDEQEIQFRNLVDLYGNFGHGITFTGVIPQKDVASIMANASFFLFPGALPETFGISTLESLQYNTPLVATRFGALEETALADVSYFIDYAIEPNNLFPDINSADQIKKFVDMTVQAFANSYLHQQKMYACNRVKEVSTWDTIALQWKQHLYSVMKKPLPVEDYRRVKVINHKVAQIFGRRFSNKEDRHFPKTFEKNIACIVPVYNAENYIADCIMSIAAQDYDDYHCFIIDDGSTDNTSKVIDQTLDSLGLDVYGRFSVVTVPHSGSALKNQVDSLNLTYGNPIVLLIDGDDALAPDNGIFDRINYEFESHDFTYGSCWSLADNIPLIAQPYPRDVIKNKTYRDHKFNWGIPYTHLRAFKKSLFDEIDQSKLKVDGEFMKAGGDVALFYELIEQSVSPKAIPDILYMYNDLNPLNDYKVNAEEQTMNARIATKTKKKILIAIPTAKNIEAETFKSIYDLIIPDGYEVEFQYFHGYSRTQIKNLIGEWGKHYELVLFIENGGIPSKNCIIDFVDSSELAGISPDSKYFCVLGECFRKIPYPHFEQKDCSKNEIFHFLNKVKVLEGKNRNVI